MRLSPTLDVEHRWESGVYVKNEKRHSDIFFNCFFRCFVDSHVRFLGNLVLNLWDCGGQDAFYESYFEMQVASCV